MNDKIKSEHEYIMQFSGDIKEKAPLVSVTINQYWDKEKETNRDYQINQKGAE